MTQDSPNIVGSVLTRRSTERPPIVISMRPSCGSRVSAMSRPLMTFTREMSAGARCGGGASRS